MKKKTKIIKGSNIISFSHLRKKDEVTTKEIFHWGAGEGGYKIVNREFNRNINIDYLLFEVYNSSITKDFRESAGDDFVDFNDYEYFYKKFKNKKGRVNIPFIIPNRPRLPLNGIQIPENCFIEFANTKLSELDVLYFANKYGLLGFDDDSNYIDIPFFKALKGESLMKWFYEIWFMKRVLKIWSHCWNVEKLIKKEFVSHDVQDFSDSMHYDEKDDRFYEELNDPDSGYLPGETSGIVTNFNIPKEDEPPALMTTKYLRFTADVIGFGEDFLKKEIKGYTSKHMQIIYLDHMTDLINNFLNKRNFKFRTMAVLKNYDYKDPHTSYINEMRSRDNLSKEWLNPDISNEQKKLNIPNIKRSYNAKNLISELWCQCSEFITSNNRIQQCNYCDNFYIEKREDSKFCSNTCRVKNFNLRNKNKGGKK